MPKKIKPIKAEKARELLTKQQLKKYDEAKQKIKKNLVPMFNRLVEEATQLGIRFIAIEMLIDNVSESDKQDKAVIGLYMEAIRQLATSAGYAMTESQIKF